MRTGDLDGIIQGGEFQKVYDSGDLAAAATSITITGLNGNNEKEYVLISKDISGGGELRMHFNNDTGNNYGYQEIYGISGSAYAYQDTSENGVIINSPGATSGRIGFGIHKIYAKSGYRRTVISKQAEEIYGTTVNACSMFGYVWNNTSDNITSIVLTSVATNGIGIGSRFILLRRNAQAIGGRTGVMNVQGELKGAFQKVYETTLSSAATSVAISDLDGNTAVMYKLVVRHISGATPNVMQISFNNDTGANYGMQTLYGTSGTMVTAYRYTGQNYIYPCNGGNQVGDVTLTEILAYAKSGAIRPIIYTTAGIYRSSVGLFPLFTQLWGGVWDNTSDNITSIQISHGDTNGLGVGTHIELYAYRVQTNF